MESRSHRGNDGVFEEKEEVPRLVLEAGFDTCSADMLLLRRRSREEGGTSDDACGLTYGKHP